MGGKRASANNKLIYPFKLGVWEIKMGVLILFIMAMLVTGAVIQHAIAAPHAQEWKWQASLAARLGVTFKEPWQLTEADLTRGRVMYNLLTKPGFAGLLGQVFLALIVLAMTTNGLVWIGGWQFRQWRKLAHVVADVSEARVRFEITGTVQIVSHHGLIYAAVPDEVDGNEDGYGFYIANVTVSVIRA